MYRFIKNEKEMKKTHKNKASKITTQWYNAQKYHNLETTRVYE